MTEHFKDRSFKRLTDAFPVPMLKYLNVRHDMTKPYKTTLEITNNNKQFLDFVYWNHIPDCGFIYEIRFVHSELLLKIVN